MATNSGLTMTLPILDGKNYERWSVQMKVLFGYQEVLEIVQDGYESIGEDATKTQRSILRECKKKDCKALFIIHQCVDGANFEKIANAETTKEAWDNLEKSYAGAEKVKKVKLQTLRREYELLQMKEGDSIANYFTKIRSLSNLMKRCGEVMKDQLVVEKVLRTLTFKFDHVVVVIEESKDLEAFKIEELQSTLEAHEQRIKERDQERNPNQALQAQFNRRNPGQGNFHKKSRGNWKNDRGRDDVSAQKHLHQDQSFINNKKKIDKKKIQCYNCKNLGHYACGCRFKQSNGSEVEASMAHGGESEDEQVLLMVTTEKESVKGDYWYLDTGCS
ncbi:PREDICTED: uncharacterized protein LOC109332526 [Lupinus angustifolius]|uniref:uncharacterized protein LOC109332526 n=1 Tax=Lupinus angustifolius TaxID=3871 RepID=UPI00092ED5D4|nr:PREDICTED: uncharacterized protein LOC109332526 [Lupinus angustifolius]